MIVLKGIHDYELNPSFCGIYIFEIGVLNGLREWSISMIMSYPTLEIKSNEFE